MIFNKQNLVTYTKPFKSKDCYVAVERNETSYITYGIDIYGDKIHEECLNYDRAMYYFYFHLCWMINNDVMSKTTKQRHLDE